MIDRRAALEASPITTSSSWSADDVVLYQLGLGAGDPPDDPREVRYVFEQQLAVLPTFASVLASTASTLAIDGPGLEFDRRHLLHIEQELQLTRPVPPSGTATNRAFIESLTDRGRDAAVVVTVETHLAGGALMATNRFHLLARGAGGFDDRTSEPVPRHAPRAERAVDRIVITPTLPQQAALFRLSSDRTPVHVDPVAAVEAGLERPSLQGLCTWGVITKMLIEECLDGDQLAVRGCRARFTGIVFPGETLESRIELDGATIRAEVIVRERQSRAASVTLST